MIYNIVVARELANIEDLIKGALSSPASTGRLSIAVEAVISLTNFAASTGQVSLSLFEMAAKQAEEGLGAAQCLQSLGNISYMRDEYDDAQRQLEDARQAFEAIGDRLDAAQCLRSLGNISYMRGEYDDAQRQLEDARQA